MSGTSRGALKKILHIKGKTKTGDMIAAMNKAKVDSLSGSFNGAGRVAQTKVYGRKK